MSYSLRPHGLQHARLPCLSPTPGAYSNSCPSHRWCHPTISSCVVPFSSRLQSFPASGSFPVSQFFPSGGQSIVISASASVLSMSIQDCFPLEWMFGSPCSPRDSCQIPIHPYVVLSDPPSWWFLSFHGWELYCELIFSRDCFRLWELMYSRLWIHSCSTALHFFSAD